MLKKNKKKIKKSLTNKKQYDIISIQNKIKKGRLIIMTKKEYFKVIKEVIETMELENRSELLEFLNKEIDILERKSANKKLTANQTENIELMKKIEEVLILENKPMTIKEIQAKDVTLADKSNQRVSALLKKLKDEGYLENEEQEELEKKAKENKIKHNATSTQPRKKPTKPKTVHISDEKKSLFNILWTAIFNQYNTNAKIEKENKLILVTIGDKTFKIDIIEQRKVKK